MAEDILEGLSGESRDGDGDISSLSIKRKPSRKSGTPFQFIEEDPLIACVGTNGGTSDYDIFRGFADAVGVIYKSVAGLGYAEDVIVYPMAFSARHGIELGLKISIREMLDFLDLDKLGKRVTVDREGIKKNLLEHNIKTLTDDLISLLQIDDRLKNYEDKMVPYLSDYYFDEKGDMFRYAESRESKPNLADHNIGHISLTQLYDRFMELCKLFERFYADSGKYYEEYLTGSFTVHLSRKDISGIAEKLPDKTLWTEDSFDIVKNRLKAEYRISGRELSDAINIIQSVPEFSVKIGMERKFHDIPDDELDCYRALLEWRTEDLAEQADITLMRAVTVETFGKLQRSLKEKTERAKGISICNV